MSPDEAREILKSNRGKGRPDAQTSELLKQARDVLSSVQPNPSEAPLKKRGRPKGDPNNQVKVIRVFQKKKEKTFDDYPLANIYLKKGAKFSKYLSKLPDEQFKIDSQMSIKTAKELVSLSKTKGRPSVVEAVKRVVAHEFIRRFDPSFRFDKPKKDPSASLKALVKKNYLRDKFKDRRRRNRSERRKQRLALPKSSKSELTNNQNLEKSNDSNEKQ